MLRTGVLGCTVFCVLSPEASVRVTLTGAGLVVTGVAGIIVAEGGVTFARTGTASVTGAI